MTVSDVKVFCHTNSPYVFSRGSLKLTYDLLRYKNPQLALNVRNIAGGKPIPKSASQPDNKHADFFRVTLDSFQVRAIVEGLLEHADSDDGSEGDMGRAVMAKSLVSDWMVLARKMIAELPDKMKS